MGAKLVEDAGELVGDIAAAGDDDSPRQIVEVEGLVGADGMLDALDRGHCRAGAGGDQDGLGAELAARGEANRIRPGQLGALGEDLDAIVGQGVGIGLLQPPDFGEDVVAQHRPAEATVGNVPAEHRRIVQILGEMGTEDEQFLGHAATDDAGAANFIFLGDGDPGAMGGGDPGRAHPARTSADDEQVIVVRFRSTHSPALSMRLRVDGSKFSRACGSPSSPASRFPSSTPNWSNGLMPSSTALAKVRCS